MRHRVAPWQEGADEEAKTKLIPKNSELKGKGGGAGAFAPALIILAAPRVERCGDIAPAAPTASPGGRCHLRCAALESLRVFP